MSKFKYWKNLSELTQIVTARLRSKGLTELDPVSEDVAQGADEEEQRLFREPGTSEARPVRLDKNQIVWVRPYGTSIDNHGYRRIEVSDKPPKSDIAIVAALTAEMATAMNPPEAVRKVVPFVERWNEEESRLKDTSAVPYRNEASGAMDKILREPLFQGHELTALRGLDPRVEQHIEYVKDLLRHYRPGFDDLPYEERIALVEHTCRYVNGFLEALRKLVGFVEHGAPQGTLSPMVKDAVRDVRVAELHDVAGLSYRRIAEIVGEPLPKKWLSKNDHPKVRKMGDRGRDILQRAFGKEGWKAKVAAMKEEVARWRSLAEGERWLELMAVSGTKIVEASLEETRAFVSRRADEKAEEQGITREEAALRWAERGIPKASVGESE